MKKYFSFTDFIAEIFQRKKFVAIQFFLLSVFAIILALSLPKTFTSSATILPPGQSNLLNSILPQSLTRGLTGALGGGAFDKDGETTKVLAILESRTLGEKILNRFNLLEKLESPTIEDGLESLGDIINVDSDDNGIINISVNLETDFFHPSSNEDSIRVLVKEITEFIIAELDLTYTKLGTQKAKYEISEIEKRYNKNIADISDLEIRIRDFSKETGVISLPEQVEASIKIVSEIESQIIVETMKLELLRFASNEGESAIEQQKNYIQKLKNEQESINNFGSSPESGSVLPSIKNVPDYSLIYYRLQREYAVQNLIYEYLTQQYEQLKLKEAKDSPSLQFIDTPRVPTKRTAPSRSLIVIAIVGGGMFFVNIFILIRSFFLDHYIESVKTILNRNNS